MLLHCETDGAATDEGVLRGNWLRAGTLDTLTELNELCLALLAEQAAVGGSAASALLLPIAELWRDLDGAARRRAAGCPYPAARCRICRPRPVARSCRAATGG